MSDSYTPGDIWLMPPMPGACPMCAGKHDPGRPHDRDSLYYQLRFRQKHGRMPTWADAMAHCDEKTRAAWTLALKDMGLPEEELDG